jgi:hypothetical protein
LAVDFFGAGFAAFFVAGAGVLTGAGVGAGAGAALVVEAGAFALFFFAGDVVVFFEVAADPCVLVFVAA